MTAIRFVILLIDSCIMNSYQSLLRTGKMLRHLIPVLPAVLAVVSLPAQVAVETIPTTTIKVQTEPFVFYELQTVSGLTSTPVGKWKVGDGSIQQWVIENSAEAASHQVVSTPIQNLNTLLNTIVEKHGIPAVSALVFKDGKVQAMGATGTRCKGVVAPVTLFDKWHNGSVTKGMTATLAAILVEEGLIAWETTLGEVFPGRVAAMADGWSQVTLKQLLSNTSGAPGSLSNEIWTAVWNYEGLPRDARLFLIDLLTPTPLAYAPGTSYAYSNAGFSIAGAMLEKVTGIDWETLMHNKLFAPLGMHDAGFGVAATPRMLNQPYGHGGNLAQMTIYEPSRISDNPPAIGPSATAHSSLVDMARYLELHLRGERGETGLLLQPSSFDTLHTLVDANSRYALGWLQHTSGWLSHTGSNTYNYANVWIAPANNWACVVYLNYGGSNAFEISDEVVVQLINHHM